MKFSYQILEVTSRKEDVNSLDLITVFRYVEPDSFRLKEPFDTKELALAAIREYGEEGIIYKIEEHITKPYTF